MVDKDNETDYNEALRRKRRMELLRSNFAGFHRSKKAYKRKSKHKKNYNEED